MKGEKECIHCEKIREEAGGKDPLGFELLCDNCGKAPEENLCKTCGKEFIYLGKGIMGCQDCTKVDSLELDIKDKEKGEKVDQKETVVGEIENLGEVDFPFDTREFSAKQLNTIVALAQLPPEHENITDLCAKVGINRTSYYRWMANNDFVAARDALLMRNVENSKPIVMSGLLKACAKGNPKAIALWFQYVEKWVPIKELKQSGELQHRHFMIKRAIDQKT